MKKIPKYYHIIRQVNTYFAEILLVNRPPNPLQSCPHHPWPPLK